MGLSCLKGTLVQQKTFTVDSPCDTEWSWKVWEKTNSWFRIQLRKNCANFIQASEIVEISNFIGLFCLKRTLVQRKTVVGVSPCGTEEPWKVWGKIDSWFPIQPWKKSANFAPASQKVKVLDFMGLFCLKGPLVQPKTVAVVFILWHWRPMESLRETWLWVSNSAQRKICQFCSNGRDGSKFQILRDCFV